MKAKDQFGIHLLLILSGIVHLSDSRSHNASEISVVAYYAGGIEQLADFSQVTHLNFAFAHLVGNTSRMGMDSASDIEKLQKMVGLKTRFPHLKVLVSMGGRTGCETCSDAFSTAEGREEFADSAKQLVDQFNLDGLDLDWEYPTVRLDNDIDTEPVHKTSPADREHFTDLLRRLRTALGENATVSFAAGAFQTYLEKALEWKEVSTLTYSRFVAAEAASCRPNHCR